MIPVRLPVNLDELWSVLTKEPDTGIYAGGTDLLVKRRRGLRACPSLTCIERIEELRGIREEEGDIFIGASTTFSQILESHLIRDRVPLLVKAIRVLGSPHIRNMGTIGGNIATASPAGDTLPPLYALDAELEILARQRSRRIAIDRFIKGPGITELRPGEIISGLRIKKDPGFNLHHYEKVGQRSALSIAIVSLAAAMEIDGSGIVRDARLAWGSVGPTVVRSARAEDALRGKPFTLAALRESAGIAREAVHPIDDIRAGAEYRRIVAGNLVLRLHPPASRFQPEGAEKRGPAK